MASVQLHPQTAVSGNWYQSQTGEDTKAVVTGKGMLHTLCAVNANAAARYVYVFDNTAASGTQIAGPFLVAAGASVALSFQYGIPFSTGLYVAFSTGAASYVASGGTDGKFTIGWAKRAGMG